jgi:hypothetical protein
MAEQADPVGVVLADRDSQRLYGVGSRIELDYWTLVAHSVAGSQELGHWDVAARSWKSDDPALRTPFIRSLDDSPLTAVFHPTNPEIARPQTFESLEFYFRPRTDGNLRLMALDREIADLARGTGEWIINPGFSYAKVVFTAAGFEVPDVVFTPKPRSRLSPLAQRASRVGGC